MATLTGVLIIRVGVVTGASFSAVAAIGIIVDGRSQAVESTRIKRVRIVNSVFLFKVEPLFPSHNSHGGE